MMMTPSGMNVADSMLRVVTGTSQSVASAAFYP